MNSILTDNIENSLNDINSFILPMNIYEILTKNFEYNATSFFKSKKNCQSISNFIVNKYIITEYYPPTIFKVASISFDRNPMNTTIKINGVNYLLNKYFDKFHGVQLKYKNQPILICDQLNYIKNIQEDKENHPFIKKKKKDIFFLPCECCHLIKEDNYLELLQNNNTPKNISTKIDKIDVEEEEDEDIISYQDVNIFNYVGKVVEIEQDENSLIYINQKIDDEENWLSFNQNQQRQYQSKLLNNKWILLFPLEYKSKAKALEQNLINTGKRFGVNVETPKELIYRKTKDNNNVLQAMKDFFQFNSPILFRMILILLDPQSKNDYEKLKQYSLEEVGIISQFILVEKMTSLNINFFNSILLQMITKSGSELFRIDFTKEISYELFFSICGLYFLQNNNGTITLCLISSYNEYFNNYHLNLITVKNDISQIKKGLQFLLEDAINNFNIIRNDNPKNFLVYLSTEKHGGENFITFSIVVSQLKIILSTWEGIVGYCIMSPFPIFNCQEGLYFFQINKPKSKSIIYFIYENNTKIETVQLKDITLKLSYYYWNNYNVIPFPSCLKYAEIGIKMMKKYNININNVKQRLLNEPFYL